MLRTTIIAMACEVTHAFEGSAFGKTRYPEKPNKL